MGEVYSETYLGCKIYHLTPPDVLKAVYRSPCVTGSYFTIGPLRKKIDEMFVGPPEPDPDEDPADGLLAQITAGIKSWFIENIQYWVETWGRIINNVYNNITKRITNVYNDVTEYVTKVYNNTYNYVTEVYKTFNEYVTNVTNVTKKYITNNITNITKNITNIIGITAEFLDARLINVRAYVDQRVANIDTVGFFKNPVAYISGVFAVRALVRETDMIKSFLEGFEEGLEEEVV